MKTFLFALAAILSLVLFAPSAAEAGSGVYVSVGVPIPAVVYPTRGYYCDPAPAYYYGYAPRSYYYQRPARVIYRGKPYGYRRPGYHKYYRGRRYCD